MWAGVNIRRQHFDPGQGAASFPLIPPLYYSGVQHVVGFDHVFGRGRPSMGQKILVDQVEGIVIKGLE